jgi:hypothetical protein
MSKPRAIAISVPAAADYADAAGLLTGDCHKWPVLPPKLRTQALPELFWTPREARRLTVQWPGMYH